VVLHQLKALEEHIRSMEFTCPICVYQGRHREGPVPLLKLDFDEEVGEAGVVLSSWPILSGQCQDEVLDARSWPIWRGHSHERIPLNHADRINLACQDSLSPEMAAILGEYRERKAVAKLLGVYL
jgi:hypothetical protein